MKIAVLLTCHNRRDQTITCLESLAAQGLPRETGLTTYLVDDGCTDGTGEAVRRRFPEVRIIRGNGDLFWCGGMRVAWHTAAAADAYDSYLWLNDDVKLFPGAVSTLVTSCREAAASGHPGIIAGSTCDPTDTARPTFGGRRGKALLEPAAQMRTCDTMHGNIVLVPREVFTKVGNLSLDFRQMFGDFDYGLRARKAGFEIWVAPGFAGECSPNPCPTWADPKVPFATRWRHVHSPKGFPPHEHYIYSKRHFGWGWINRVLRIYLRVLFPGTWDRLLAHRDLHSC